MLSRSLLQQRASAFCHPPQHRGRPSPRRLQQPAMGRSSGRQGALAESQDKQNLAEDLSRAWQCDQSDVSVGRESTLARLWAGYGTVSEVTVVRKDTGARQQLVVKRVQAPAGSGVSHERKLKSYQVEAYFYGELAPRLLSGAVCAVPQPLSVLSSEAGGLRLLLSDLRPAFPISSGDLSLSQARAALEWLAGLHACFWEQPRPPGVWEQGCYWYLDTRQEELESMGAEHRQLKAAAAAIDARLKGLDQQGEASEAFRTLLHGDFKSANLLFSAGEVPVCAAYDFQYCGEGYGARDVAYLLTSSVQRRVLGQHESSLLRHYHAALVDRLTPEQAQRYTFGVFEDHFELSVADFVRFMAGWGYWGASTWADEKTTKVLKRL